MTHRMPLSEAEKRLISQRKEQGNSLQKIAEELACAYETVRKWWHCQRDHRALRQRGRPKQGVLSTFSAQVIAEAIAIKQAHPHWGPPNVKVELRKRLSESGLDLPSDARLSVLFKQDGMSASGTVTCATRLSRKVAWAGQATSHPLADRCQGSGQDWRERLCQYSGCA